MEFRLLGPVEARRDGAPVPIVRRRERLLLALLLLEAPRQVTADRCISVLWPEARPADPRAALQVTVSRLRAALGPTSSCEGARVAGSRGHYRIEIDPDRVDAHRFTALLRQARATTDIESRRSALRDALGLWRGPALQGVGDEPSRDRLALALEEARLSALEERIRCDLALGEGAACVAELRELAAQHPFREGLAAALMSALWQAGRNAESLASFRVYRNRLVDELGIDPGPDLVDLERQILLGRSPAPASPELPVGGRAPHELPSDVPALVGRTSLVREAEGLLDRPRTEGRPVVLNLHGGAGIGKSSLAVRIGHRLSGRHPDGSLFLSLRAGSGHALSHAAALDRLLRSVGVPAASIPDDAEARSALWRTQARGRRLLVVLDDAADVAQVRPLVPSAPGCTILVTSRRPLIGLEQADVREVPPLAHDQARLLLRRLVGAGALNEPQTAALETIVSICSGMPLALRIVGARLASLGLEQLPEVAAAMADRTERLDWLVAGDLAVRTSLELAYADAGRPARALFDRLAPLCVDSFGAWAAAAVADCPERVAEHSLAGLVDLGLVLSTAGSVGRRYRLDNLVRSFAEQRWSRLSAASRRAAYERVCATAVHLVGTADSRLEHGFSPLSAPPPAAPVSVPGGEAAVDADPRGWLDQERDLLVELVRSCGAEHPEAGARLALYLDGHLMIGAHTDTRYALLDRAVELAARGSDTELRARVRQARFNAWAQGDRHPKELTEEARVGMAEAEVAGDPVVTVRAVLQWAYAAKLAGDRSATLAAYRRGVVLAGAEPVHPVLLESARAGVAQALADLDRLEEAAAVVSELLATPSSRTRRRAVAMEIAFAVALDAGRIDEARVALEEMSEILDRVGDEPGQGYLRCARARLALHDGDVAAADGLLEDAEEILRRYDDVEGIIRVLRARAELAHRRGEHSEVAGWLERAVQRCDAVGNAAERHRCDQLRIRLRELTAAGDAARSGRPTVGPHETG